MRNLQRYILLAVILLVAFAAITTSLDAKPSLARDPNGIPIQFTRSFSTARDTISAGTTYDSLAVPANSVQCTLMAVTNAAEISTVRGTGIGYYIPTGVPVTIPVMGHSYIYYRRYATGSASILYFLWQKM